MSNSNEPGTNVFGNDLSVMHEVLVTGRKCGIDKKFWSQLANDGPLFSLFKKIAKNRYNMLTCYYDDPYCPEKQDILLHDHQRLDKISSIYLVPELKFSSAGHTIDDMINSMDDKPAGASLLDLLLECPCLIPKEWSRGRFIFGGTIYTNKPGQEKARYARYLAHSSFKINGDKEWYWMLIDMEEKLDDRDYLVCFN